MLADELKPVQYSHAEVKKKLQATHYQTVGNSVEITPTAK